MAALIEREERVLIARRPQHKHMGLKWEFPGGKVEEGEPPSTALLREIREELGVDLLPGTPLAEYNHDYETACIRMMPFLCRLAPGQGEPTPHEHAGIRWVTREEIRGVDMAPADWPAVDAWIERGPTARTAEPRVNNGEDALRPG